MDTARLNRRVVLGLSRLLLAAVLLAALLPSAGVLADDPPAPLGLPADVYASVLAQVKKLTAGDGARGDHFGDSVAISGDTVVIGAYFNEVAGKVAQGSAYVFGRNQGGASQWGLVKELVASDGAASDYFGYSVAVSGDTIVVGAYNHPVGSKYQGAAYVYQRDWGGAGQWGQVKQLVASDGTDGDSFGRSVAISGDTIVVGAYNADGSGGIDQGAAYVYQRDAGGADQWGQVKQLFADDGDDSDNFGSAVAIAGDTIVVGAYYDDVGSTPDQGSAYVFYRDEGGANQWGQVRHLIGAGAARAALFGFSAAIAGDTIVVGAFYDDVGITFDAGSAYVYQRDRGGADQWGQVRRLVAGDGGFGDRFGFSAAIAGDTIVLGACRHKVGSNLNQGAAYVYQRDQGGANNWGQAAELTAADGAAYDEFGSSVAIGDTVVVGASYGDVASPGDQGSAYVFKEPAKLRLRNTDQSDPLPAGWIVRYTISVTNASQVALPLITVVDTLPPRTVFVQAGQGGRRSGGRVTWKLTNVPAGTTVALSLWVRTYSTMRGYILNQATATSEGVTVKAGQSTLIVAPSSALQPAEELPPAD